MRVYGTSARQMLPLFSSLLPRSARGIVPTATGTGETPPLGFPGDRAPEQRERQQRAGPGAAASCAPIAWAPRQAGGGPGGGRPVERHEGETGGEHVDPTCPRP